LFLWVDDSSQLRSPEASLIRVFRGVMLWPALAVQRISFGFRRLKLPQLAPPFFGTKKACWPYLKGRRRMVDTAPDRVAEEAFNIAWEFLRRGR
jgi:hypothetical protein